MKRQLLALCALLFLPALALAQGDMVSIAELRSQAEAMGRWTQVYEAYGRTVEVDIPIIVPEADAVPIVTVEKYDTMIETLDDEKRSSMQMTGTTDSYIQFEDSALLPALHGGQAFDSAAEVFAPNLSGDDPTLVFEVLHQAPQQLRGLKLEYNEAQAYYPYEMDAASLFAPENPLSLADALDTLRGLFDYYCQEERVEYEIDYAEVRGRALSAQEQTVDSYPMGTYYIHFFQQMCGLPVLACTAARVDTTKRNPAWQEGNRYWQVRALEQCNHIEVMDSASFFLVSTLLKSPQIVVPDIPLAPIEDVIAAIEREIAAGRVRSVYALRLGYCCYVNDDSPENFTLSPVWLLECSQNATASEDVPETFWTTYNFREKIGYTRMLINAQDCAVQPEWLDQREQIYCPEILTWEDIQ